MLEDIMTERECAELARVDVKTIRRARLRGEPIFPYLMVGDLPRYSRSAVLAQFAQWPNKSALAATPTAPEQSKRKVGRPRKTV